MAVEEYISTIKELQGSLTHKSTEIRLKPYWWNMEIEEIKKEYSILRRRLSRIRSRDEEDGEMINGLEEELRPNRKRLKKEIRSSQRMAWKRLIDNLENDVWGEGYKIVSWNLREKQASFDIDKEHKKA